MPIISNPCLYFSLQPQIRNQRICNRNQQKNGCSGPTLFLDVPILLQPF